MPVYLSLGSNLGDREGYLDRAVRALEEVPRIRVVSVSRIIESEPMGEVDQPAFLNMAVGIETAYEPLELLDRLKSLERELGRTHTRRWGPREIDIDIVLWDDRMVAGGRLTVPHPEFRKRAFVLVPLAEIAPDAIDPETGKTVRELLESPETAGAVRTYHSAGNEA